MNGWQCGAHGSAETYWIRVVSLWSSAALRREPAPKLDGRSLWPAVFGQRASRSAGTASLVLFFACRRSSESQHSFKMFASGPCAPPFQISTTRCQDINSRLSISREAFSNPMDAGKLVSWVYPILEHALFIFDGVIIACLAGSPHLQTCFSQFRWSENSLSGGNAPSSDMLCEIPMEWK